MSLFSNYFALSYKALFFLSFCLIQSCSSEFITKEQAKNEVTKKGFRDGRWVDYLDSNDQQLEDTINYSHYLLSEYDDGNPINLFRTFYRNGKLRSIGSFMPADKRLEKDMLPNRFSDSTIFYNEAGGISNILKYNSSGLLIQKTDFIDTIIFEEKYKYFDNSDLLEKIEHSIPKYSSKKFIYKFDKDLSFDDTSKIDNKYISYNSRKIDKSFSNDTSVDIYLGLYFVRMGDILKKKYSILHLKSVSSVNLIDSSINALNDNVPEMYRYEYKKYASTNRTNSNNNSASTNLRCYYCGNPISNSSRFIIGLTLDCAKSFRSLQDELRIGAMAGFPKDKLRILANAYDRGENFCSRRCVYNSGNIVCDNQY